MVSDFDLILTATDRLARELRARHSLDQRLGGRTAWEALPAQSLRQWTLDVWLGSWPLEQLLHPVQEIALWRGVIEADEAGSGLLSPQAAAREARHADQLLLRHALDLGETDVHSEEQRAFLRWRRKLRRRLAGEHWITAAELGAAVTQRLREGRLAPPARVRLAGFVGPLPRAEAELLDALALAGSEVIRDAPAVTPAEPACLLFPDAEAQLRHVALRIAGRLRPCRDSNEPPPRLLIVSPDPDGLRPRLEAVFRPLLAPWRHQGGPAPWRWESGRPLTEYPWIDTALAVARLGAGSNDPDELARLLLSSTLWTEAERQAAAALDFRLRAQGHPRVRWTVVESEASASLRDRVAALGEQLRRAPRRDWPSAWAEHFEARLAAVGWPGPPPLSSLVFQVQREWRRSLDQLAGMDRQLQRVGSAEAVAWLGEILRGRRFEPRAEHEEPVLIVAPQDSLGLHCDELFLLDATAEHFPGPARLTPFVPRALLLRAEVPQASPARQLAQARALAQHWLSLAPSVTVCASREATHGGEALPSSLFASPEAWRDAPPSPAPGASPSQLCWPAEDAVPAVTDPAAEGIRGGARLFRDFAEAPFFAFCRHRLGIDSFPVRCRGLNPVAQGLAIHEVLERIWGELGDSEALRVLPTGLLAERLEAITAEVLQRWMPAAVYGQVLLHLERARVVDLVGQWLGHERRRVDPFRVLLREHAVKAQVAGLDLRLRVDRIDAVATPQGERFLVLDYKTGAEADARGWDADRLREPQLPLYASSAVLEAGGIPQVDGICFAHVRDGHPALVALTRWRQRLIDPEPGQPPQDWDQQLALWRTRLEAIARAFLGGEARLPAEASLERGPNADLLALRGRTP